MKKINIANKYEVTEIGLGCMRMAELSTGEAEKTIKQALSEGITFFDHADIYGGGKSEEKAQWPKSEIYNWNCHNVGGSYYCFTGRFNVFKKVGTRDYQ